MQVQILQVYRHSEALSSLLLDQVDEISMAPRAIHQK